MSWKDILKAEPIAGPFDNQEEASEHIMFNTDHLKNSREGKYPRYVASEKNGKWYVYEDDRIVIQRQPNIDPNTGRIIE